jgi:hypothetical protein
LAGGRRALLRKGGMMVLGVMLVAVGLMVAIALDKRLG